jgi:hypothetical protein
MLNPAMINYLNLGYTTETQMGEQQKRGVKERRYTFIDFIDKTSFLWVFVFWMMIIIIFGIGYFMLAINPDNSLIYRGNVLKPDAEGLYDSIYYSFITVTTTGYGDISPSGLSKLFSIFEVILGVIIEGILVSKLVGLKQETILEEIYNINYEEAFTNYRRGLSLVRTDIVMIMEKIENKTIKQRELRDLWIIFSGLDGTLTNIKNIIIPSKKDTYYNKKLDVSKVELILSSMKLTLHKVLELIRTLKHRDLDWREELLLTSLYYDVQVVKDVIEYESKRSVDRKVIDKLNALRILIDELEAELKVESKIELKPVRSEDIFEEHEKEDVYEKKPSPTQDHTGSYSHSHHPKTEKAETWQAHEESKDKEAAPPAPVKPQQAEGGELQTGLHEHIDILPPDVPHEKPKEAGVDDKKSDDFL